MSHVRIILLAEVLCGLLGLGLCGPIWKRTIDPELEWISEKDKGIWNKVKMANLEDVLKASQYDLPFENDLAYEASVLASKLGNYELESPSMTSSESREHPWRDYGNDIFAGESLHKEFKRTSLQDLLRTLNIQGGSRYKPMRFGAGLGRK